MSIADKLTTIAENEQRVYDKGKADGIQTEYDRFWDNYQREGLTSMYDLFSGSGWTKENFKPKYDIKPKNIGAYGLFRWSNIRADLYEISQNLGIEVDVSECNYLPYAFAENHFTGLGVIDTRKGGNSQIFQNSKYLKIIRNFIPKETASFADSFKGCSALTDITVGGKIGRNISFADCPLSINSMKSIISALQNYAGTTSADTYRLTFSSACWTKLEADSTAPNGGTWEEYVSSLGWLYS